ncbi:MAG: amidohydrolase family protein [Deltaproteobacteria bacterium]|nr:amidohydrolase family protein [Candidatus Anaeroferrophillus wilburensis]MBN2890076.1 amidohydrolase family protein [Deltaproteobacteria bacterium]
MRAISPAFVDTHLHLSLGGDARENARRHYAAGIGLVRDAGDRDGCLHGDDFSPLTVVRTGPALFKAGCYGSFIGDCSSMSLSEKIVRTPGRFVKVLLTGLVSFDDYGAVGKTQWTADELREIVQTASRWGKKVMVHVNSDAACRQAVQAGVHSLEHGYFIGKETLMMMADQGIYWTPTIAAMANQLQDPAGRFTAHQRQIIEKNYRRQLEMIGVAHEVGTPLTIGTDSGSYNMTHGEAFFQELELYRRAGIAQEDLLRIATVAGWEMLDVAVNRWLEIDLELFPSAACVLPVAGDAIDAAVP